MPNYEELVELARICRRQAHLTQSEEVARHLHKMATEFAQEAAKLNGGALPDLGNGKDPKPLV